VQFVFKVFCFFLILCSSYAQDLDTLRGYAKQTILGSALEELNRAVQELGLRHGKSVIPQEAETASLILQLQEKEYLHYPFYRYLSRPFLYENGSFHYPEGYFVKRYVASNVGKLELIQLLKEKDPDYRLFALQYLEKNPKYPPVVSFLMAFMQETESSFFPYYVKVMKTSSFYENRDSFLPEKLKQSIASLPLSSKEPSLRAEVIYLQVGFAGLKPKTDTDTFVALFDGDYPLNFMIHAFEQYGKEQLNPFVFPFKNGYGNQWEKLARVFAAFPDNPVTLQALAYALINRDKGHFASFQPVLLQVWEQMTGIQWEGDESPFISWYKAQKAKLVEPEKQDSN
jgi:hypothetical protein